MLWRCRFSKLVCLFKVLCGFTVEDMCRRYPNATALSISGSAMHLLVMRAISSLRLVIFCETYFVEVIQLICGWLICFHHFQKS